MPNWCQNVLIIRGRDQSDLIEAWRIGRPFQQLVPAPTTWTKEEIETLNNGLQSPATEEITEENAWYWWRLGHWGTKWDVDRDDITICESESEDGVETVLTFGTAWSPPIPVIEAASCRYPHLTLKLTYCESSMEYAGEVIFVGGVEREGNHHNGGREYRRIAADFGWEADEEEGDDSFVPSDNDPSIDWPKEGF